MKQIVIIYKGNFRIQRVILTDRPEENLLLSGFKKQPTPNYYFNPSKMLDAKIVDVEQGWPEEL